jgi:hypothetical protein
MGIFIGFYWFRKHVANYGRYSTCRSGQHNKLQCTYIGFKKNEVHTFSDLCLCYLAYLTDLAVQYCRQGLVVPWLIAQDADTAVGFRLCPYILTRGIFKLFEI